MKGQSFIRRVGFAWAGLRIATLRESSFRFHILAAALVFIALGITRAPIVWWAFCILAIGIVFVAELVNTALETLADHLHPEQHPQIGVVKDLAAAAVLVASLSALAIAFLFVLR
jgi:diacylglycerol kinase (ATP)